MMPGQLGPTSRHPLAVTWAQIFTMSSTGIPSVMQTISGMRLSAASTMASPANAGRNEDDRGVGARGVDRLPHGFEHRHALDGLAPVPGRRSGHHLGAVGQHLPGVEPAFVAR